jgi:hypothetical protein
MIMRAFGRLMAATALKSVGESKKIFEAQDGTWTHSLMAGCGGGDAAMIALGGARDGWKRSIQVQLKVRVIREWSLVGHQWCRTLRASFSTPACPSTNSIPI